MKTIEFIKPTIPKVSLAITLIILTSIFLGTFSSNFKDLDHASGIYGFPFTFLEKWHGMTPEGAVYGTNYFWYSLFADIIFWYIISCLIFIKKVN